MSKSAGPAPAGLLGTTSVSSPAQTTPEYSRRDFLTSLTALALGVNGFFAVATVFKMMQPPTRSLDGKVKLGWRRVARFSGLSDTEPTLVQYGEDWVYLTRRGPGALGLNAACPHVRCKLAWDRASRTYRCPCHTSAFDLRGRKLYGPAFRDMFAMMVRVEGDRVMVGGWAEDQVWNAG